MYMYMLYCIYLYYFYQINVYFFLFTWHMSSPLSIYICMLFIYTVHIWIYTYYYTIHISTGQNYDHFSVLDWCYSSCGTQVSM